MNYIELINAFWMAHDEYQFNVTEIALFFYLVKWCNHLRWKNPFMRNNALVNADLDISKPTLTNARKKLKQAGLINFKTVIGNPNVEYWLIEPKVEKFFPPKSAPLDARLVPGLISSTEGGYYSHNININKTKSNKTVYRAFAHLSMDSDELDNLIDLGYGKGEIDGILDAIENFKDNKKYSSLHLTSKKWLERNAAKKKSPVAVKTVSQTEKERKKRVNKTLEAFEVYKSKGKYTDWDCVVYDFLDSQGMIPFTNMQKEQFMLMAVQQLNLAANDKRAIVEAKQIALNTFFNQLAEVGEELKKLLN